MRRSVVAVVGACLFATALLAAPTTGATTTDTTLAQPDGFDRTVFDVTVHANGSADWAFEHRRVLANDSEEATFQDFADTFESTETDLYIDFVGQSRVLARTGTNLTGREMAATNHSRSASVDSLGQTEGVVRMSFRWRNFAEGDGDRVVVADVFEGGLVLAEDQRIVFERGEDVRFDSVQPGAYTESGANLTASDSVTFFGPREFADRRPRVEYVRTGGAGSGPSNFLMAAGVLVAVLGVVAGLAWRTGLFGGSESETADVATGQSTSAPEIRSDSDRVIDLLEDNGGRMKQVNIVDETDWSKSKVSMLLSDMEDDGDITKLRVGRENIVSLAGEEPDAAGSPFDDEE